jgi:hypothetical protein
MCYNTITLNSHTYMGIDIHVSPANYASFEITLKYHILKNTVL